MRNNSKTLSKAKKIAEAKRQIKTMVKNEILPDLIKNIYKAINSGAVPEEYYKEDNYLLSKAIIDSFCQDRPFKALAKETRKEFDNINNFI